MAPASLSCEAITYASGRPAPKPRQTTGDRTDRGVLVTPDARAGYLCDSRARMTTWRPAIATGCLALWLAAGCADDPRYGGSGGSGGGGAGGCGTTASRQMVDYFL